MSSMLGLLWLVRISGFRNHMPARSCHNVVRFFLFFEVSLIKSLRVRLYFFQSFLKMQQVFQFYKKSIQSFGLRPLEYAEIPTNLVFKNAWKIEHSMSVSNSFGYYFMPSSTKMQHHLTFGSYLFLVSIFWTDNCWYVVLLMDHFQQPMS